jgi:DNA-directed RNA polymerase
MYYGGIKRAETMLARAEEEGRAHNNPYAKEVFRDYVLPLADAIRSDLARHAAGKQQAHAALLSGLDLEAVAFLSVRYVFSTQLSNNAEDHRSLCTGIGRTVHQELLLGQVEDYSPELYHTLVRDLGRRLSKDERYRMTVMRMQAQKAGIVFTEWPIGARQQVGSYILDMLQQSGFIVIGEELRKGYKRVGREVYISPDILERIDQIKSYIAISMPVYGPCIEPPRDWTSSTDGGFHTRELRRANPFLVRGGSAVREIARNAPMPTVLAAVNALQRTAWAVNERVLDIVYEVAKAGISTKEIVSLDAKPKPVPPVWLVKGMQAEDMTEAQQHEFRNWKRRVADWHTERKLMATRYARFYSATRQAEEFRHYWALYFVYFADSRGRLYPMTYGLNPQGSDLGKALLRFAEGKPVDNANSIRWFHVHGANKWGFDKATLEERHAWVVDKQEEFCAYANDPINNRGWTEAGDPLQFLAWCFEYRDWVNDRDGTFLSHLPISMDGSCNGLQNLSALFRDEIGGRATNLTDNRIMEDIYRRVAEAATVRLSTLRFDDEAAEAIRTRWLEHGINRKVVKRSVMTTPYGVTLMSATDYVVDDYLADTDIEHPFDKTEWKPAARVLMKAVWPAIGDVVVKGREAMDWLKRGARKIVNNLPADEEPIITWETPSGFPACQAYFDTQEHRINTRLQGLVKIKVVSETDEPSLTKHASGLAPNFVHSMDAAHLHRTTQQAAARGISSLAMIHDDYGTHAADSQNLFEIIRREFVSMYEFHDPIEELCKRYPALPAPPSRGNLDIREVLRSAYFFS